MSSGSGRPCRPIASRWTACPSFSPNVASPASAYLALFGLLVLDAFVPLVPTQVVMITAGALTIYGNLSLPLTIGVGALGVFCGDTACYLLGRTGVDCSAAGARPVPGRAAPGRPDSDRGSRSRQAAGRFTRALRQPGPLVILLCRFVPAAA